MKIAGRKNDGAWFRTNKFIAAMGSDARANLADNLLGVPSLSDAFDALTDLASKTGVAPAFVPADATAWIDELVTHGIPRQIWMGQLSFDTYTKTSVDAGPPEVFKYYPDHDAEFRAFGRDVRAVCKRLLHGLVALNDLTNTGHLGEGNPGGYPDADKTDGGTVGAVSFANLPKKSLGRSRLPRSATPVVSTQKMT